MVSEIEQAKKEKHVQAAAENAQSEGGAREDAMKDIPELDGMAMRIDDADTKSDEDQATINIARETNTPISTLDSRPSNPPPMPFIVPQRRPGKKRKGFARTYAPVVENAGIGQDIWMKFFKNFYESSQASSVLKGIQIEDVVAAFVPDVTTVSSTLLEVLSRTELFLVP